MKKVKVEWCENFIRATFGKYHIPKGGGIETNFFWKLAAASGLYEPGTYGTPMSSALSNLVDIEIKAEPNGDFLYRMFKLKEGA